MCITWWLSAWLANWAGNEGLCGQPLESCKSRHRRAYVWKVAISLIIAGLLLGFIIGGLILYRRRKRNSLDLDLTSSFSEHHQSKSAPTYQSQDQTPAGMQPVARSRSSRKAEQKLQLSFVSDYRERFNLQDLLRASAEVLGSGNFGSSYKANIMNGQALVVKRYKQMNSVGREEFNEHTRRLGRLKHPNLLPLVAYYYRKEEKLLVYDFVPNGSLASHLHGKRFSHLYLHLHYIDFCWSHWLVSNFRQGTRPGSTGEPGWTSSKVLPGDWNTFTPNSLTCSSPTVTSSLPTSSWTSTTSLSWMTMHCRLSPTPNTHGSWWWRSSRLSAASRRAGWTRRPMFGASGSWSSRHWRAGTLWAT